MSVAHPSWSLPPAGRAWGKTILIVAGGLAAYVAAAVLVTQITGDAIAGAAVSNLVVTVLAIAYRWRSTGTPLAPAPQPRARRPGFWMAAAVGLVLCWLVGQAAGVWVYETWGSPGLDAANSTKLGSPVWLLVLTVLILAPLGEESLMRGIAFPALRKHWPPLTAALCTSMVFALLHGNIVQIVLTVPLGILLALVYEVSQRLWPVVFMHVLFNMASSFVPRTVAESFAGPGSLLVLALVLAWALFALTPWWSAGEARGRVDARQAS